MAAENFKVKKGLEVGTGITANSDGINDEFTFNVNGTYQHKTNKTVYGKASPLISDFGSTSNQTKLNNLKRSVII